MTTRVTGEPAYVLHHYDWSESSVIVEAFTRHHGRVALVARGAKKPSSNFRPVLLPMQALLLAWSGDAEVRALKGVEWGGGPVMPTSSHGGDALLAGYYAGELLLRLLARDDPHPRLFDGYTMLMHALADSRRKKHSPSPGRPKAASAPLGGSEPREAGSVGAQISPSPGRPKAASAPLGGSEPREAGSVGAQILPSPGRPKAASVPSGDGEPSETGSLGGISHAAALRAFELLLLREAGLLPALDAATLTLSPLAPGTPYRLSPEGGLLACEGADDARAEMDTPALPGACWLALEQALADTAPFAALMAATASWAALERAQLRHQLRAWLHVHGGGRAFKTRQLLHDLQTL